LKITKVSGVSSEFTRCIRPKAYISNPEAELKNVYQWYHERKIMLIKGSISIALSLIIALIISYLKSEIPESDVWLLIFPIIFTLTTVLYGIIELNKVRRISKKYIAAITLLNQFKNIRLFLKLYRSKLR